MLQLHIALTPAGHGVPEPAKPKGAMLRLDMAARDFRGHSAHEINALRSRL
jgi:hypothetical protein